MESPPAARYRVRIGCSDCTGQDDLGCFDGGTELLEGTFDTVQEAESAGYDATKNCGPWYWQVLDEADQIVSES